MLKGEKKKRQTEISKEREKRLIERQLCRKERGRRDREKEGARKDRQKIPQRGGIKKTDRSIDMLKGE